MPSILVPIAVTSRPEDQAEPHPPTVRQDPSFAQFFVPVADVLALLTNRRVAWAGLVAAGLAGAAGLVSVPHSGTTEGSAPPVVNPPTPRDPQTVGNPPPAGDPPAIATEPGVGGFAVVLSAQGAGDRTVDLTVLKKRPARPQRRFWLVLRFGATHGATGYLPVEDLTGARPASQVALRIPQAATRALVIQVYEVDEATAARLSRMDPGELLRRPPCVSCTASGALVLPL